jgi:hypothetical protein
MQCILYQIYFWKVFHMYYKLICILYTLLCGQNFILVKSGCYTYNMVELNIILLYIQSCVWGVIYVVGLGVATVQIPQRPFPYDVR